MKGGKLVLALGAAAACALLGWSVLSRLDHVRAAAAGMSWSWALAGVACALASHAMGGLALAEVLGLLGHALSKPAVLGISLVSTTANYVLSTGGVSGFALKAHLLHKRRVPIATTIVASAVASAALYGVLAAVLAQGLVALFLGAQGSRAGLAEGVAGLLMLLAASGLLVALFMSGKLRTTVTRRLFHWTNRAAFQLSRREIPPEGFDDFEKQLGQGLGRIRRGHGRVGMALFWTALDWGFALISLWLCFRSVGEELPLGPLTAVFAVSQGATLIPVLPGGLGAAESSSAAVLEAMGFDGGRALVAALVYRGAYYLLPSLLSVLVFWGLKVSEPGVLAEAAAVDEGLPKREPKR